MSCANTIAGGGDSMRSDPRGLGRDRSRGAAGPAPTGGPGPGVPPARGAGAVGCTYTARELPKLCPGSYGPGQDAYGKAVGGLSWSCGSRRNPASAYTRSGIEATAPLAPQPPPAGAPASTWIRT